MLSSLDARSTIFFQTILSLGKEAVGNQTSDSEPDGNFVKSTDLNDLQ